MNIHIGRSIKTAKAFTGKSNVKIAKAIGVTPTYLSTLSKKQHCNTEIAERLATAYGYGIIEFLQMGMKQCNKK